jgi:hypothetical protein
MAEADLLKTLFPHFMGISVEQVVDRGTLVRITAGLTYRYGRDTLGLRRLHEAVGLTLGGRAGARLVAVPLRSACSAISTFGDFDLMKALVVASTLAW